MFALHHDIGVVNCVSVAVVPERDLAHVFQRLQELQLLFRTQFQLDRALIVRLRLRHRMEHPVLKRIIGPF